MKRSPRSRAIRAPGFIRSSTGGRNALVVSFRLRGLRRGRAKRLFNGRIGIPRGNGDGRLPAARRQNSNDGAPLSGLWDADEADCRERRVVLPGGARSAAAGAAGTAGPEAQAGLDVQGDSEMSNDFLIHPAMQKPPVGIPERTGRPGTCRKQIDPAAGTLCGKPFTGPPSRKYCDEHSRDVRYRGR
jgi:hypothetical protein